METFHRSDKRKIGPRRDEGWKVDVYPWIPGNPLFVIHFRRALAHSGKASRYREFIALSSVENSKIRRLHETTRRETRFCTPLRPPRVIELAFERKLQA